MCLLARSITLAGVDNPVTCIAQRRDALCINGMRLRHASPVPRTCVSMSTRFTGGNRAVRAGGIRRRLLPGIACGICGGVGIRFVATGGPIEDDEHARKGDRPRTRGNHGEQPAIDLRNRPGITSRNRRKPGVAGAERSDAPEAPEPGHRFALPQPPFARLQSKREFISGLLLRTTNREGIEDDNRPISGSRQ